MTKHEIAKELQIIFKRSSVGEDVFSKMADFVLSLKQKQSEALTVKELYSRLSASERYQHISPPYIYDRAQRLADYFNEQSPANDGPEH